jgi:hypothetical protein
MECVCPSPYYQVRLLRLPQLPEEPPVRGPVMGRFTLLSDTRAP